MCDLAVGFVMEVMMDDDAHLLARYARTGTEEAFAVLVRRRIGLVYGVALRRTGNVERAKDATQAAFVRLARNAGKVARHPAVVAWLCRAAYNAATDIGRAEQARARREKEANAMMQNENARAGSDAGDGAMTAEGVRPLLDEALLELEDMDRAAVMLRFFDGRAFAEIGAQLRLSENAARMRVQRALEKLRRELARKGITTTAVALGTALGGQAVAAPAGLAATVTGVAMASGVGVGTTAGIFLTMKTMQIVATVVVAGVAGGVFVWFSGDAEIVAQKRKEHARDGGLVRFEEKTPLAGVREHGAASKVPDHRALDAGGKVRVSEMAERGNATPVAAVESWLRAQEGGDLERLVALSHLGADARREAEKFFAGLPAEQRARFGTPERLVAAFFCGAGAMEHASSRTGAKLPDYSYEVTKEEIGVKMTPLAMGLPEETAEDENFYTVRTTVRRANGTVVTTPVFVFQRTSEGWKYVVPPSHIPAFARLLAKGVRK